MTVGAKQKRLSMTPYTPVVKSVLLKYGYREARELGNGYFGTEHLLLGLLSGKAGLAFKALENQAVELLAAGKAVQDCVAPEPAATAGPTTQAEKIESGLQAKTDPIKIHPIRLPDFKFREPDDRGDVKMLADIRGHGWHVVFVPADEHGPRFAFTVGLYLRRLQPEILIMGVDQAPSGRVLNAIGDFLMWSKENFDVEGDVVFTVPTRDVLLATGSSNIDGIERMKKAVATIYADKPNYRLTGSLFTIHHN